MFAIDCPTHGHRVLIPERRIRGLHNTPDGILIDLECWCGTHVTIATGRRTRTTGVALAGEAS